MSCHDLFGYLADIDEEATSRYYKQAGIWSCECGDCLNFLALAKRRMLPDFVLRVLDTLKIDPQKATYVCLLESNADGWLYQFGYRIAGTYQEPSAQPRSPAVFCGHNPYPYDAPNFPSPHFDLEFFLPLPWIPDEPRDG
ncbi:MAG: hypothetical protein E7655_01405 [Ruminococcaceae bacterium]|nr:hypothetical protein [Oscillospiraceae bacterium]